MTALQFFDASWGSVRLWCARLSTDNSRTQVVHELAEGDEHPVQDRGLGVRKVTCELLFVEMPSEPLDPLERFRTFKAQVDDGERLLFVHPIDGSYYVNAEAFNYTIDEDGNITDASITFIKSAEAEGPTPAGAGVSLVSGFGAVTARAAAFTTSLDAVGITSTVGTDAVDAVTSWSDALTIPTRQVVVDIAALSDQLSTLLAGLEEDLALFDAYQAAIFLGSSLRAAALAALADTPKLTAVLIGSPISALALCVRVYGGGEAEDRVRQILGLNDIRTPGWIPQGSVIMMPVPSSARRARAA